MIETSEDDTQALLVMMRPIVEIEETPNAPRSAAGSETTTRSIQSNTVGAATVPPVRYSGWLATDLSGPQAPLILGDCLVRNAVACHNQPDDHLQKLIGRFE